MRLPGRWRQLRAGRVLGMLMLALMLLPAAQAHLMVAQRGTLNLVGDGAFLVLSLPVSSLAGVDDDGDEMLSPAELQRHAGDIQAQVRRGVQLLAGGEGTQALPLQGMLLQLSSPDHAAAGAARQLLVMGRFALGAQRSALRLRLRLTLFGAAGDERSQQIVVSRGDLVQRLLLAPGREEGAVLPDAWSVFADHLAQGMAHVLGGADHLLFLLVVLASGGGLRRALQALSCFTVGHGLSLAAVVFGGLAVPSGVVEPAIAATIVGMALYDRQIRMRERSGVAVAQPGVRLALVFGCALIHGLGLAGALGDLGLDPRHRLWSLAGFNAGIEAGQLMVALVAAALLAGIRRSRRIGSPSLIPDRTAGVVLGADSGIGLAGAACDRRGMTAPDPGRIRLIAPGRRRCTACRERLDIDSGSCA